MYENKKTRSIIIKDTNCLKVDCTKEFIEIQFPPELFGDEDFIFTNDELNDLVVNDGEYRLSSKLSC